MSSEPSPDPAEKLSIHGVVQSRVGDTLWVTVERSGCGGCNKKSACGIGRLSGGAKSHRLSVPAHGNEAVGDTIRLHVDAAELQRAAAWAYLAPALGLLFGAAFGDALAGDGSAVLGALSGLALGLGFTRRLKSLRAHRT